MIRLIRLAGHSVIAGNCKADDLAKSGTSCRMGTASLPSCGLASDELSKRWSAISNIVIAKSGWQLVNPKRFSEFTTFSTVHNSKVLWVLTENCPNEIHALKLKIYSDTSCLCSFEENEIRDLDFQMKKRKYK